MLIVKVKKNVTGLFIKFLSPVLFLKKAFPFNKILYFFIN